MSNEQYESHPPEERDSARRLAELEAECARLRQMVQRLEEQKERDAEVIEAAISALNESNRSALKWAAEQWSEETWQDFEEEDYRGTLEELIEELEREPGP